MPMPDLAPKDRQEDGSQGDRESLRQGQNHRVLPVAAAVGVEHGRHRRPEDAGRVVEHVDDAEDDGRSCEVPSPGAGEYVGWGEGEFSTTEGLPQGEEDQDEETNYQGCHDVRIVGGVDAGPDNSHQDWNGSADKKNRSLLRISKFEVFRGSRGTTNQGSPGT